MGQEVYVHLHSKKLLNPYMPRERWKYVVTRTGWFKGVVTKIKDDKCCVRIEKQSYTKRITKLRGSVHDWELGRIIIWLPWDL